MATEIVHETPKCQCPKAIKHEPNECPDDYEVKLYRHGVQELWLCRYCTSFGDVLLTRVDGLTEIPSAKEVGA